MSALEWGRQENDEHRNNLSCLHKTEMNKRTEQNKTKTLIILKEVG